MLEFDCETVSAVLATNYTFIPLKVKKATGYACCNYLVDAEISSKQAGSKLFVKTLKGWDDAELVRMQHALLEHVNRNGISASRPIKSRDGDSCLQTVVDGQKCIVQVFDYLDGTNIIETLNSDKELRALSYDIGQLLGKLHKITESFTWDYTERENFLWHPGNGVGVAKHIDLVVDQRIKYVVEKYLKLLQTNLIPSMGKLRKGFIHCDYNDGNILLLPKVNSKGERSWKISGLIDFQECGYHVLVGDLGICTAYMMMRSCSFPDSDALETVRLLIQGYNSINPMTASEKETIFEFMVERLILSYVWGRYLLKESPENADTILVQSKHIPKVFELIDKLGRDAVVEKWFQDRQQCF